MTEPSIPILPDDNTAPSCGLYIILQATDDHNTQNFKLGQALHAANRFSTYNLNRHLVLFRSSDMHSVTIADVMAYRETCLRNGFIFLVMDDIDLARGVEADGILCSSIQIATTARKTLNENAIIGLRIATKNMARSALTHALDFISIYTDKDGDNLIDILNEWVTATDNPIAVEGLFDPENCYAFVEAGASFIDSSQHIWTHPSRNVMQGVVNMLDAFERHKVTRKTLN